MPQPLSAIGIERGDKVTRLEAFVDASFAFALTLLVISGDSIPEDIDELSDALKQIPAYAASFYLIIKFWASHAEWSRRFGLDDVISNRLSLTLVFLLLIFVYPLKMVFSGFFSMMTDNWLPSTYSATVEEIPIMFQTFAAGFGAMALLMVLLFWRAARLGKSLGFSEFELWHARWLRDDWMVVVLVSIVSLVLSVVIPAAPESGYWVAAPGFIFFALNIIEPVRDRLRRKRIQRMDAQGVGA